jgi:hypothetical protein
MDLMDIWLGIAEEPILTIGEPMDLTPRETTKKRTRVFKKQSTLVLTQTPVEPINPTFWDEWEPSDRIKITFKTPSYFEMIKKERKEKEVESNKVISIKLDWERIKTMSNAGIPV